MRFFNSVVFTMISGILGVVLIGSCSDKKAKSYDGQLQIWTEHVNNKVQPSTMPGTATEINLRALRSSVAAAQIILTAVDGNVRGVTVETSDLECTAGTIPAENIAVFRQDFIDFTGNTAEGGTRPAGTDGRIPDPLVPLINPYTGESLIASLEINQGENQPLWVDFAIPASGVSGNCSGEINIIEESGAETTVPVTLFVHDLELRNMGDIVTHFRLHLGPVIDYHAGIYDCNGNDCWLSWEPHAREVVRRYEELVHSHRIDGGQHMFYMADNGCSPVTDWEHYDNALTPYMDGTYFEDGVPSTRLDLPFSPGVDWGLEADCTPDEYIAVAASWSEHLKEKGWFNKAVAYCYDEPPDEALQQIADDADLLISADPDYFGRIMLTTAPDPENIEILGDSIGIFTVAPAWYDNWGNPDRTAFGRDEWTDLISGGTKLWFYESNAQEAPFVSFATNTLDGAESTMFFWGSFYEGATGFLYWSMTSWTENDPWGVNDEWNKTGDGVLIYPGHHNGLASPHGSPSDVELDGPIPSYRLKMIRQGLSDWSLFIQAEMLGLGSYVREQIYDAYRQLGGCTWTGCNPPLDEFFWATNPQVMDTIRENIITAIISGK
ncbi:DUF4091 domain-containing protein [Myxococcota bacterium]|nr:DUF4091 domain-containing protein [Myxococcota bacterium]MBU1381986.1 DUF4091 domain-containing protein [Myxococcota bacterium]MBU1498553.1 DUF4091 domain-containing protein [Myxococcota bacterium]